MWYPHFLQFHERLVETLNLYDEWKTPLVTKFTVRGGWAMPKDVVDFMVDSMVGVKLYNYARWFWSLHNGWTMCALFTQNSVDDLITGSSDTNYTGECTMDVKFYFIETVFVQCHIGNDEI